MDSQKMISLTKNWVEKVVIGLNLCPFAKVPFSKDLIKYSVFEGIDIEHIIAFFLKELNQLIISNPSEIETTLLIIPDFLEDFSDYLEILQSLNNILSELNLEGIIQIASFHPGYQFEDSNKEDVENYTNRSPFPMFHLLREDSLEKAIETYQNPEEIPQNNMEALRELGLEKVKELLNEIRK